MRPASLAEEVERVIAMISPNGASSPVSETEIANHDRLAVLELQYVNAAPKERAQASVRIERGPVGKAAKRAANYRCQLCAALGGDGVGFRKPNGEPYVEAHHVMPVHLKEVDSLSCTNVMILCANHHRQLHYGRAIEVQIEPKTFQIAIDGQVAIVPRLQVQIGDDEAIERQV